MIKTILSCIFIFVEFTSYTQVLTITPSTKYILCDKQVDYLEFSEIQNKKSIQMLVDEFGYRSTLLKTLSLLNNPSFAKLQTKELEKNMRYRKWGRK